MHAIPYVVVIKKGITSADEIRIDSQLNYPDIDNALALHLRITTTDIRSKKAQGETSEQQMVHRFLPKKLVMLHCIGVLQRIRCGKLSVQYMYSMYFHTKLLSTVISWLRVGQKYKCNSCVVSSAIRYSVVLGRDFLRRENYLRSGCH